MNAHDVNAPFRALLGIARAQCANHRRDDHGWPLGNCVECKDYRAKMDAWYMEQVMSGGDLNRDSTLDRNTANADGWGNAE
jgi:hypothetical protein